MKQLRKKSRWRDTMECVMGMDFSGQVAEFICTRSTDMSSGRTGEKAQHMNLDACRWLSV